MMRLYSVSDPEKSTLKLRPLVTAGPPVTEETGMVAAIIYPEHSAVVTVDHADHADQVAALPAAVLTQVVEAHAVRALLANAVTSFKGYLTHD